MRLDAECGAIIPLPFIWSLRHVLHLQGDRGRLALWGLPRSLACTANVSRQNQCEREARAFRNKPAFCALSIEYSGNKIHRRGTIFQLMTFSVAGSNPSTGRRPRVEKGGSADRMRARKAPILEEGGGVLTLSYTRCTHITHTHPEVTISIICQLICRSSGQDILRSCNSDTSSAKNKLDFGAQT
jgi:hypothetical protein